MALAVFWLLQTALKNEKSGAARAGSTRASGADCGVFSLTGLCCIQSRGMVVHSAVCGLCCWGGVSLSCAREERAVGEALTKFNYFVLNEMNQMNTQLAGISGAV